MVTDFKKALLEFGTGGLKNTFQGRGKSGDAVTAHPVPRSSV